MTCEHCENELTDWNNNAGAVLNITTQVIITDNNAAAAPVDPNLCFCKCHFNLIS